MFLITTPLKETWKENSEILLLGEWCKDDWANKSLEKLNFQLNEYHWDDRNQFLIDNKLIESIYEKYLAVLSSKLNVIHQKNHSIRYWRIIVGLWLRYFIEITFDRYSSINNANKKYNISETWILNYDLKKWIPLNYQEFHKQSLFDSWNHILYAEIIKFFDDFSYKIKRNNLEYEIPTTNISWNKKVLKKLIIYFNKIIPDYFKKIFFVNSIIPLNDFIKLQYKIKQIPNFFEILVSPIMPKRENVDRTLRQKIRLDQGMTDFEKLLDHLIPNFLPKSYLESFSGLESDINKIYPKKVEKIYTANAYSYDEAFKIWTASQVEKGTKLIIGQHGGRAGIAKVLQSHLHQIKISDNYISWGWDGNNKNIIPLPSIKLSNLKYNHNQKITNRIIVVLPSYQKYFYHSSSMPLAGQCINHFQDQLSVLDYLENSTKKNYYFRFGPRSKGFNFKKILYKKNINMIDKKKYFEDSVNSSRLVVHSDNSTSLLETMAANFPSLIFWNPKFYELTEEAKPFFDKFYDLGIMHYDSKSVAKKINEIYSDINQWWQDEEIQNVRNSFSKKFCLSSSNYLLEWKNFFTKSSV